MVDKWIELSPEDVVWDNIDVSLNLFHTLLAF